MAVARETVRLGLAARGHGQAEGAPAAARGRRRRGRRGARGDRAARGRSCCDELNVKELRFVAQADELGSYEVKPNYRTLGPRFGKQMPQVAAAVAALDPAHVAAALRDGGRVAISVDGHDHELGADDLTLALQPLEGYQLEREGSHAVALDLAARRRAAPRGARARGRARGPERAQGRRAAGRGPDRAGAGRRRRAAGRRARPRGLPRAGDARRQRARSTGGGGTEATIEGRHVGPDAR